VIPIEELEALRRAAIEALQRLQRQFESVGLTWLVLDHGALSDNEESHTVELRIWFYRDGEPVDFLEFFLFHDGAVVASEEDIRSWVEKDAMDVIAKQRQE